MKSAAHQYEDKLLEFAYGELPQHEAETVDAHVRGCNRCAQALFEIRGVRATMAALPMEAAPDAGLESLLAYAEQAARRGGSTAAPSFWKRSLMPLSSVIALVTVGVVAFRANEEFDTSPASALADAKLEERAKARVQKKEKKAVAEADPMAPASGASEGQAGPVVGLLQEQPAPVVAAASPEPSPTADSPAANQWDRQEPQNLDESKLDEQREGDGKSGKVWAPEPTKTAPQSVTRRAPSKKNGPVRGNDEQVRDDYSNAAGRGALAKDVKNEPAPAPPPVQPPAEDKGGGFGLGSAAPQKQRAEPEGKKTEKPALIVAAPPAAASSSAPSFKSKGGYGIKPQLGTSGGSVSGLESESDDEALRQSDRLSAANFDKRKTAESRTRSLESARVASSRGDRLSEIRLLAQVLQSGATGYERVEALKRICDAYEALGEVERADPFCDQLLQEFPTTAAAKTVEDRRKRVQRTAPASKSPTPEPERKASDEHTPAPAQAPASSY